MRRFLLVVFIFSVFVSNGQTKKIFKSDFQISEEALQTFDIPYKITVIDPKVKNVSTGSISIWDIKYGYTMAKNKISYLRYERDDNGNEIDWYTLFDNPKANIFKIQRYAKPMKRGNKTYKALLIFSLYDENNIRVYDLGMLSNPMY